VASAYLDGGPPSFDITLLRVCLIDPPEKDAPFLNRVEEGLGSIILQATNGYSKQVRKHLHSTTVIEFETIFA
jgi:hypothetical protein